MREDVRNEDNWFFSLENTGSTTNTVLKEDCDEYPTSDTAW